MRQKLVIFGFGFLVALVLAAGAAVLLSDDEDQSSATPAPEVTQETTQPQPTTPDPNGITSGVAQCRTNRSASDPFGLTFSRIVRTQRGLLAEWQTNRPMPPSGVVLYAIDTFDDDGLLVLQLGVKYLDGAQIAFFVFDFESANQTNLTGGGIRNGLRLEAIFPQDAISDLDGRFRWRAALSVEADDAIACPPSRGANPLDD